jgi:outer membrane receptor protein involved in Fe transport
MRRSLRHLTAACLATTCMVGFALEASAQIEEIIVTTRKRAESLQEVPIVITAFTAESLQRKGLTELKDVIKYTSGVQFDEGFSAQDTRIVIRGLSPTRGRPNVAFLQDDVDISSEAINTAGSSFLINPRLFDVERIEIVKGPHSALFGRSAFAGAINYITKKPGDEFEGTANVEVATYGKVEGRVGVSGPVVEGVLNMGLNVAGWRSDGFHDNSVTGGDIGGGEGAGVAASAVFTPNETLKATIRSEYSSDHFDPQARAQIAANTLAPLPVEVTQSIWGTGANPAPLANPRLNGVFPILNGSAGSVSGRALLSRLSPDPRTGKDYSGNDRKIFRTTLRLDLEFELATLSSISHYGTGHTTQFEDAQRQGNVNSGLIGAETNFKNETRLLSEEIRLVSNGDGPLTWAVGALYWNETAKQNNRSFTCFTPTGAFCGPLMAQFGTTRPFTDEFYGRDTMHHSVYALAEYDITDQLGLSIELRRTWEDEDLSAPNVVDKGAGCPVPFRSLALNGVTLSCATQFGPFVPVFRTTVANYLGFETRSKFWAPRFGIDYKLTDDVLLYASASKGIKPGGVSTISGGAAGIDEAANRYLAEKLWVYESGMKSTWMDGTVQFNVAGYYQDFSDKQTSTQLLLPNGSLGTRIINASSARVYGVDLETGLAVNDNLTVSVGYTWLDAKYNSFNITGSSLGTITNVTTCVPLTATLQPFVGPASVGAATNRAATCGLDRTGNKLEDTPTHSLQFAPSWTAELTGELDYFLETSVQYTSKRFDTEDNNFFFPSYWNVDLRAGLIAEEAGWEVTAFVTNLFDDDKIKTGFASPDFNRSYCLGGVPCNIPPIPPLGAGPFNFVLPNHFTASLPDKRQFGVRAKYSF